MASTRRRPILWFSLTTSSWLCGCFADPYYLDDEQTSLTAASEAPSDTAATGPAVGQVASGVPTDELEVAHEDKHDDVAEDAGTDANNAEDAGAGNAAPTPPLDETSSSASSGQGASTEAPSSDTASSFVEPIEGAVVDGFCFPVCQLPSSWSGGWGRQDGHTCLLPEQSPAAEAESCTYDDSQGGLQVNGLCYPPCPQGITDIGGDGISMTGGVRCIIVDAPIASGATPCPHP